MYVGWSKSHLMNVEAVISGLSSTASAMSHELREASPFHICSYQAHFKVTGFAWTGFELCRKLEMEEIAVSEVAR